MQALHTSKRMHFIEELFYCTLASRTSHLHTSKRMHFIEEIDNQMYANATNILHTSKRMHFIEDTSLGNACVMDAACIRQNVCTSLRRRARGRRWNRGRGPCIRQNVCTSLRIEYIRLIGDVRALAYVKTYALH